MVDLWCGESAAGCEAVLGLVRRMAVSTAATRAPRLWLLTRGGQPVLAGERVAAAQAPIWGLGKTIAFELPELRCTLVDLDPSAEGVITVGLLTDELLADGDEDQVALRGGRRLVARLLPYRTSASCSARPMGFRGDRSYLITGGLGGLGLTVAAWMVEQGARHLVLAGRSPPSSDVVRRLDHLRTAGAELVFMPVDVARMGQVEALVTRIRRTMPGLGGIVHAAGLLDNGPIVTLDADRLARVMAPKVEGAWNLHLATRDDDLEFFALFSSAVSVLGSPGQGNYSAANSFLDALAHLRRAEGRPAVSINWGPWAEVGLVADGDFVRGRPGSDDRGVKGIEPRRGLEALGRALADEAPQVTVLPFDLRSLLELYPQAARRPLFAEVGGGESHVAHLYARPKLRQEYVAPRTDIEQRLAELWRQTLRIDRVGIRDSFFELGGDSVLAAQLVSSTHRTFGVELDLREAFKAFTIEQLAARVEAALERQVTRGPDVTLASSHAPIPLSFVQERQLFLEMLDPLTAVNNLATCLRIEGPLDLPALERSANRVISRHEALRTSFDLSQGRAIPQVAPALSLEIVTVESARRTVIRRRRRGDWPNGRRASRWIWGTRRCVARKPSV